MKAFLIAALFLASVVVYIVGVLHGISATTWQGHAQAIGLLALSILAASYSVRLSHDKPKAWKYTTEIRRG